jgi:hypothetical protein
VKFDSTFPTTWPTDQWVCTNQWHTTDDSLLNAAIAFTTTATQGKWQLVTKMFVPPSQTLFTTIWDTNLNPGMWHDIQLRIAWGLSSANGSFQLWHNGIRETLKNGSTTYNTQTAATGSTAQGHYYKEGCYRSTPTTYVGIIYHKDFRVGTAQSDL